MGQFNIALALWYIKRRKLINFLVIIILLVVNTVIGLYIFTSGWQYYTGPSPRKPDVLIGPPLQGEEIKEIEILAVQSLPSGNVYDLVAQIRNPNQEAGLRELDYKFVLLDASGGVIREIEGQTCLLPQESRYIIRSGVDLAGLKPIKVQIELYPVSWIRKKKLSLPDLVVLEEATDLRTSSTGQTELFAITKNESYYSFQTVEINIVLLDSNHSVVGVNYTTFNNFYTQTKREFRVHWPGDLRSQADEILIELETNVYDGKNFIEREKEDDPEEPGEYRDT